MTRARHQRIVLKLVEDVARRLAVCEARHFRCAVRHARTGRERARVRRDYWHRMAFAYAKDLEEDDALLRGLGLADEADRIVDRTGERMGTDRVRYLKSRGLDPRLADSIAFVIEDLHAGRGVPAPSLN